MWFRTAVRPSEKNTRGGFRAFFKRAKNFRIILARALVNLGSNGQSRYLPIMMIMIQHNDPTSDCLRC